MGLYGERAAMLINLIVCAVVLLCVVGMAQAQEMIDDPQFSTRAEAARLTGWRIDPAVGGNVVVEKDGEKAFVTITPERVLNAEGKQEQTGRLMQIARKPVLPGRRYTLSAEARGEGQLTIGAIGFVDRYSPVRTGTHGETFELTPEWKKVSVTFTPGDEAMCVSAFFQMHGWLQFASVRNVSMLPAVGEGVIGLEAGDFVFTRQEGVALEVKAEHARVKVLVYGPGGVPAGPGGPYGGSDAWVDHFCGAQMAAGKTGEATRVKIDVPTAWGEGFYRAVAVDLETGQAATAHFCIYPEATAKELRRLADGIALPEGTRIVFLGDSLTDMYRGRNYVDLVTRALAKKNAARAVVINAGVSANNIGHIDARLARDVAAQKPTHVFLFEGANDSKRAYIPEKGLMEQWAYPYEQYVVMYRAVVNRIIKETGCKPVLMTTAPGDQRILEPFRKRAERYRNTINYYCLPESIAQEMKFQKELAGELGLGLIDVNAHFLAWMEKEPARPLHVDDGVHLSEEGNLQVALLVLRYLAAQGKGD